MEATLLETLTFNEATAVARVTHTALQAITHRQVLWYSDRQLSCLTGRSTFSGVGAF